ncbi:MAG: hypothetical protein J2P26_09065 [Nocardiopsaceae bacterium]|nr:hypothetical protein [Nocardiopsaceae bacterium]
MNGQSLNLREALRIVRRSKTIVGVAVAVGLVIGAGYGSINPPVLTAQSMVLVQSPASPDASDTADPMGTQIVVATSGPVLRGAMRALDLSEPVTRFSRQVSASSPADNIITISATATSAREAERIATAVANSFVSIAGSSESPLGKVAARVLQPAATATGPSPVLHRLMYGLIGLVIGAIAGFVLALIRGRGDRRLRQRDDIADALGVPVLASVPASRPSGAAEWARLLGGYQPGAVHAWRLRKTLQHLSGTGAAPGGYGVPGWRGVPGGRDRSSVAVVSLSGDPAALALGPQLAVFAASLGIPATLVIGPQQDPNATAALRTACADWARAERASAEWGERWSGLRVAVADHGYVDPGDGLTIVVSVVDGAAPRVDATMAAAATVLGVSAGAATADQLARVGMSAAQCGRDIAGILVANPDPLDHSTGRVPRLATPRTRRMPSRLAGLAATTTETRQ